MMLYVGRGIWVALHTTGCRCTSTICTCYGTNVVDGTTNVTTTSSNQITVNSTYRAPDIKVERKRRVREYDDLPPVYCAADALRRRPTRRHDGRSGITKAIRVGRESGHAIGHSPRVHSRHGV